MPTISRTLSASAVARRLGVAAGSVANWIRQGELKAGATPGGHHRVAVDHLVEFMQQHRLPIPSDLAPSAPRILIVDDEGSVREWIRLEIEEKHPDYEIMEAKNGFTAGELVGSWKPDVVILDLRMPGVDGFEVCQQIKSKENTKAAVVIAITAYDFPEAERRILECGAQAYLTKPLDVGVLLNELEQALHLHR